MRLPSRLPLALLAVFLVSCLHAEIPKAAKDDPRFALGYVVVTHYPGVRADGKGDSTAGIQAAIRDAYENHLAVLFPAGTYTVGDTLKCYEWNFWDTKRKRAKNPDRRNHILVGSALGPNRPVIRLRPNTSAFADPEKPRPLLVYRVFSADTPEATEPIEPDEPLLGTPKNFHDQPNILFHSELRDIDLDCGGNPGAVGVAFRAAQESSIENVRIDATGATAGFRGIPGRNGGAANVEVVGGRYGIDLIDGGLAGTTAVGVRLINQTEQAIRNRDFCPFMLVGFEIVKPRGPVAQVVKDGWSTADGTLCLVDGSVELTNGGLAFDNVSAAKTLYLRNVYVRGTTDLVRCSKQPVAKGSGTWSRIAEYAYTDQSLPKDRPPYTERDRRFRVYSLVDGHLSHDPEPIRTVETNSAPPPPDLVSRHLWTDLPSYEGENVPTCVVTHAPYGALPDDGKDDRAGIQAAIDAAEKAGHGRVFLPAGNYEIGGTLDLRANTKLFGAGRYVSEVRWHDSWQPTNGEPYMIRTVDDPKARTTVAFLSINTRSKGGGINAIGANAWDRFGHLDWRAGRHSLAVGIGLAQEWVGQLYANPHDYVRITGSGGGKFYFLAPSWRWCGRHPDSRAVHVVGTTEPLSIYGLNLELVAKDAKSTPAANVEMVDAANVRIYGLKREMAPPTMILRNCHNIALFAHGRQGSPPFAGSGGLLQILGTSSDILIAPVLFDMIHGTTGEATVREAITGQPVHQIIYPDCLSVYKRGQLDDRAMQ
jgi:hypothetical protein